KFANVLASLGCVTVARGAASASPIGNRIVSKFRIRHRSKCGGLGPMMQLDRVNGRKSRQGIGARVETILFRRRKSLDFLIDALGFGLAPTLQAGINQKIHGVILMRGASHVNGSGPR